MLNHENENQEDHRTESRSYLDMCARHAGWRYRRRQLRRTAPPLVRQLYNGNWPSQEEGQKLRNELFYQRAIHAYMTMLPALNTIGMRDGSEAVFGAGYNVLPIWKERMGCADMGSNTQR